MVYWEKIAGKAGGIVNMNFDGLSFSALVAELNQTISGGRIEKIFQPDKYTLLLWIRQLNETHKLAISANPSQPRLHTTQAVPENPASPPAFCMLLRKHLEDGRIAAVTQHSLDRIAKIHIDVRGEKGLIVTKCLIIELMGKHSNIIFMQDDTIIDAIKRLSPAMNRHRTILPGKVYVYPPGQARLNLLKTPATAFIRQVSKATDKTLTKAIISTGIGLGPASAKEFLWRSGLPEDIAPDSLEDSDIDELAHAIDTVIQPLKTGETIPTIMLDQENRMGGIACFTLEHLSSTCTPLTFTSMSAACDYALTISPIPRTTPEQALLLKRVAEEIGRLSRKYRILTEELAEADQADLYRRYADILMASLYQIPSGVEKINLPDIYAENQTDMVFIPLDPQLSPVGNAQVYYGKYNKQKRAQKSLTEQIAICAGEINYLETILTALEQAEKNQEIAEIRQELILGGYIKTAVKRPHVAASEPVQIQTADGFTILVGKNNRQNDLVTFTQAQPDDLWFHTKDIPGSHVILRTNHQDPPAASVQLAALCAAYFSKARCSANVPVDFTKRRYVKKPAGAKPGFVIYERQTTINVTPDETEIKKYLT
jgi:predicted ribosome quality control (RQC) complex YloA/Tae2 family protein